MFKFLRKKHQNVIKMEFPKKPEEEENKDEPVKDINLIIRFLNNHMDFYLPRCCSDRAPDVDSGLGHIWLRCGNCGKASIYDEKTLLRLAKEELTNKNVQTSSNVYRFKEK